MDVEIRELKMLALVIVVYESDTVYIIGSSINKFEIKHVSVVEANIKMTKVRSRLPLNHLDGSFGRSNCDESVPMDGKITNTVCRSSGTVSNMSCRASQNLSVTICQNGHIPLIGDNDKRVTLLKLELKFLIESSKKLE